MAEPAINIGLSGSKTHVLCTKYHYICLDYHLAVGKSSSFVSSLIWDYVEELRQVLVRDSKRQRSKSGLLKILMEKGKGKKQKNKNLFFLTYIFLSCLMLLS